MKKLLLFGTGVLAIVIAISLNFNLSKSVSNSLIFMNIEALAGEAGGNGGIPESINKRCKQGFSETVKSGRTTKLYTCLSAPHDDSSCLEGKAIWENDQLIKSTVKPGKCGP